MNTIGIYNKTKSILPQIVEWINLLSAIYLVVTLLFSFQYQQPAFYIYSLTLIIDIFVNKRYKNVKWFNAKWTFVAMILFYLCIWIWHIFEETNLPYFQTTVEKRIGLLIAGVLGIYTNINPKLKPQYFAIPMMLTGLITFLFILYQIDFWHTSYESLKVYQNIIADYRGIELKISHMTFNLYMNCAIVFGFYGIITSSKLWKKIIYLLFIIPSILIVLTSEGRIGFITILVLLCIMSIYLISKYAKQLLIPLTTFIIIVSYIIFSNHYKIKERGFDDPRINIWELSINVIKEKPILGYGVSDGRSIFVEQMFNNNEIKEQYLTPWFNLYPDCNQYSIHPHNMFLEIIIEFGIIGFTLILLILFLPLLLNKGQKQMFLSLFILIFTFQGLTESPGSHLSMFILSWFLYILILTPISAKKENKQTDTSIEYNKLS